MEYKKDVRTKNLTLRDIHVGDWVQVWSEITERYSPPLKIIQICDDGTIYLVTSDEERPTPWEEDIKNVDVLPITPELLKGFGFELEDKSVIPNGFMEWFSYNDIHIGHFYTYSNGRIECTSVGGGCPYMHDLCGRLASFFPSIKLEWKGFSMAKDNKTLHLVLNRKLWDMIASGEKKEEYRDVNHYWAVRLLDRQYRWYSQNIDYPDDFIDWLRFRLAHKDIAFRSYENVCFHLGYTNNTMTFKIESIKIKVGEECHQDWGAESDKYYFVIKLGERVI